MTTTSSFMSAKPSRQAGCVAPGDSRADTLGAARHDITASDREADIRARLQQHWEASERGDLDAEHAIYAVDAILDYPQSGERFRGRSTIQAQRGGHPADRHFTVRRILGGGDVWVSECVITYDGVPTYSLSVMEITDGLVTHETQYFADPFPAPPGPLRSLSRFRPATSSRWGTFLP